METEIYFTVLTKSFELMTQNKLREDMDDSLLEKLLTVIKCEMQKTDSRFSETLLKCPELGHLFEKVIVSLQYPIVKFSTSIKSFALRLLGLVLGNEATFKSQKYSKLLNDFTKVLVSYFPERFAPSVLVSIVDCLALIVCHMEGSLWFIKHGLVNHVISCCASTSYYVRKTVIDFISTSLRHWTNYCVNDQSNTKALTEAIDFTVTVIAHNILAHNTSQEAYVKDCCILTCKKYLEESSNVKVLTTYKFLFEMMSIYFKKSYKSAAIDEKMLELLLTFYSCDPAVEPLIEEAIERLVQQQSTIHTIQFFSSFLSVSKSHQPISSRDLYIFLLPLCQDLAGGFCPPVQSAFPKISGPEYVSLIQKEMENEATSTKLICVTLSSLAKLTSLMKPEAVETVVKYIKSVVEDPGNQDSPLYFSCLNRNVCFAFLELISSFLKDTVYSTLSFESDVRIFEYLLNFLENPSYECNVLSEVLKLVKRLLLLNTKYSVSVPCNLKDKLTSLLCRKLFSTNDSTVDNALELAGHIISGEGHEKWNEFVSKQSMHLIVWEIAIEGSHEGFIKASALKVLIEACLVPIYWEDIKRIKEINEVGVLKLLFHYFHDPDFFIQRESLLCMYQWVMRHERAIASSSMRTVFAILSSAAQSLDLDLKLSALDIWWWFIEKSDTLAYKNNKTDYLKTLCDCGLGSSLIGAMDDYDETVKYRAGMILRNLQKRLLRLGYTKDLIPADCTNGSHKHETLPLDVSELRVISVEERDAVIETVISQSTAEQLENICKPSTLVKRLFEDSLDLNPVSCSVSQFWTMVWSTEVDSVLESKDIPQGFFSHTTMSLLEDIVASEETEVIHPEDETRDCY